MSHYVGVYGHSADFYNTYLFARFLGEVVDEAAGNKELCEQLNKDDTTVSAL